MILIADSGSTKTEWVLLEGKQLISEVNTQGINPYFTTSAQISEMLKQELIPQLRDIRTNDVSHVYYYGAGCSSAEKCEMVSAPLKHLFPGAGLHIDHDLLGAARAACGTNEGIAAILGTGSNSCLFDGKNIIANQPSLGFMLGDEGSGGYIGKELLKQYLYHELPRALHESFRQEYGLTKEIVLHKIYHESAPNRYAASFTRFVSAHIAYPEMQQLVLDAFGIFFKRHVSSYDNFTQYPISIVGSIGTVFEKELRITADAYHCTINQIIQKPMQGLIQYHTA